MRKLIATEFVTLDGIAEAPGHDEHRDGKNAWVLRYTSEEQQRYKIDEVISSGATLLGRVTYQTFAAFWPTAPNDDGFADHMNGMRKYVVSRTLKEASWNNTTIIDSDPVGAIARLKEEDGGDILLQGSIDLFNSLIPTGLIDEYRLMIFPVVLGSGKRLFRDETDVRHLQLVDSRTFKSGVVLLTLQPASEEPTSTYVETYAWSQEAMQSYQAVQNPDRVLATVLFTDIVDSTRRAAEMGDGQWKKLLDKHDRLSRSHVERFRGRFVKGTGDGMLATFDAPTRALRCAFELSEALTGVDLPIRAAIHTGEIEIRDDDVGGIGVHIAARALGEARDGGVVVTRTVRDLATGTDLTFAPLGSVGLRGVPGEWELFAASA